MPVYKFTGRSRSGGATVSGEREAPSQDAVAAMLRAEQIFPLEIKEKKLMLSFEMPTFGGGVTYKDLALFSKQFSVMLDSGLPLIQCLGILSSQAENPVFRVILGQVREDVESGSTLAEAMRKHPKAFDNLYVSMIAAGEAGGVLDIILKRLTTFVEKNMKLRKSLIAASVYPAVVSVVAIGIIFVMLIWVVPVFVSLFEGLNAPLPLPTRMIIAASNLAVQLSLPLLVLTIAGVVGLRSYYKTEKGKLVIDTITLKLPLVGMTIKKLAIARFSLTLATLLNGGIPLMEGLAITAETAGNASIRNALIQVRSEVSEGKNLVEPLRKLEVFPSMVTQVVGVGEETGELDHMLEKLADYYEQEADDAIANLLTMIEPVMIVFLGGIVGGIVVSMYLPIFTLIGHLSR